MVFDNKICNDAVSIADTIDNVAVCDGISLVIHKHLKVNRVVGIFLPSSAPGPLRWTELALFFLRIDYATDSMGFTKDSMDFASNTQYG